MHYPQLIEAPATFRVAVEHFAMACEEALSSCAVLGVVLPGAAV